MKEIKLNRKISDKYRNLVALVDDEDFEYLNQWNWSAAKLGSNFYASRSAKKGEMANGLRSRIYMHRFIMGATKGQIVDHIDHNGLNCQRDNLRIVNHFQNARNKSSKINSTSKYLGVSWCNRTEKWVAQIMSNYHQKGLGRFKTEIEAAVAYNGAARELHGEFANLNLIA